MSASDTEPVIVNGVYMQLLLEAVDAAKVTEKLVEAKWRDEATGEGMSVQNVLEVLAKSQTPPWDPMKMDQHIQMMVDQYRIQWLYFIRKLIVDAWVPQP